MIPRLKQWFGSQDWSVSIPVYVTRPDADGRVGSWSISAGSALFLIVLLLVNMALWGLVGLRRGVRALF